MGEVLGPCEKSLDEEEEKIQNVQNNKGIPKLPKSIIGPTIKKSNSKFEINFKEIPEKRIKRINNEQLIKQMEEIEKIHLKQIKREKMIKEEERKQLLLKQYKILQKKEKELKKKKKKIKKKEKI